MKKVGTVWLTICKYGFIQIMTLAMTMKKVGAVWLTICKYGFIQITTLAITIEKVGAVRRHILITPGQQPGVLGSPHYYQRRRC